MGTTRSADGTTIAFDALGAGQPLIMVDGATAHRAVNPHASGTARLLADRFRTYSYDRRGRGESTDTQPYDTKRELEDLAALIADAGGGDAIVCGVSSGAVLALDAAAAGLPIARLALFEPPFVVNDARPPAPRDYVERLDRSVAEGRRGDAVELFMTGAVGLPQEAVDGMREMPFWSGLEEIAHTIAYDGRFMEGTMFGEPLPTDRWSSVTIPTLVLYSKGSDQWLADAAAAAVAVLPNATLRAVEGGQHDVEPEVLAAVLRDFASCPS